MPNFGQTSIFLTFIEKWRLANMGPFGSKCKAIHLIFCPILATNQCIWLSLEIENWPIWANLGKKEGYTLGILSNFGHKSIILVFIDDWKVANMGQFQLKCKAINFVFCQIFDMGKFRPKSNTIDLVFCQILAKY